MQTFAAERHKFLHTFSPIINISAQSYLKSLYKNGEVYPNVFLRQTL